MKELRILATFFFFGKACSWLGGDKNESSGELEKS